MNLPSEFIRTVENGYGDDGRKFITDLPALIEECSQRWSLTDVRHVSNLSYNFVAFAKRAAQRDVVLSNYLKTPKFGML